MNETKEKEAMKVPERALLSIPLDKVEIVENVRRNFDAAEMKELAANIKKVGILQNIIVIRNGKGAYTLSAGERRVRAARMAGLVEIPASVYEEGVDPKMLQVFENLHRKDVGPVEEARGFKHLLDEGKHTIEGLAQAVDKSVKYVTRSIRLLELPKAAVKAVEAGTLSPEHGHQILRAPEDKRETFVTFALTPKWGGGSDVLPTIHDLKNEIERRLEKDLSKACFPKDKEYAGAMACSLCPFNTGNQDVLFEGAKDGKCTDGGCFAKKTSTFLREFREDAGKKLGGVKFAGYAGQDHGMPREVGEGVVLSASEAKSEAVKALLKKDPKKFGFAVLKPSRFGSKSPSAVLVCNDKDFVTAKLRKSEEKAERGMSEEERAKAHFVATHESKALFLAAAKSLKAVKKSHLVDVVMALNGEELAFEAIGVEADEDAARALKKLSEKDLLRLAWLCTVQHYELDERLSGLIEVKKVRKEARTFAHSEWERIQKEEAAKAEAPKEVEPAVK
ncbi:MAG: ParB/RepB/Spo0J family partition protein [Elusimicrobiota bacterium]|nr:ParB/RepB/Spo0J family partition protein [Elusimicrobiota bacterium]